MSNEKTKLNVTGTYYSGKKTVNVALPLLAYREGNLEVIYSPDLDMFGYGKSELEAKKSFAITMEEYFRYTVNKNTLFKDLVKHGWTIKENKKKTTIMPPDVRDLLLKNEQFREIYSKGDFRKFTQQVPIPV